MANSKLDQLLTWFEYLDKPSEAQFEQLLLSIFKGAEFIDTFQASITLDNTQGKFYRAVAPYTHELVFDATEFVTGAKAFATAIPGEPFVVTGATLVNEDSVQRSRLNNEPNYLMITCLDNTGNIVIDVMNSAQQAARENIYVTVDETTLDVNAAVLLDLSSSAWDGIPWDNTYVRISVNGAESTKTITLPDMNDLEDGGHLHLAIQAIGNTATASPLLTLAPVSGQEMFQSFGAQAMGWEPGSVGTTPGFYGLWCYVTIRALHETQTWDIVNMITDVALADQPNVASKTIQGRNSTGSGPVETLTPAQVAEIVVTGLSAASNGAPIVKKAGGGLEVGAFPAAPSVVSQPAKTFLGVPGASADVPTAMDKAQALSVLGIPSDAAQDDMLIMSSTAGVFAKVKRRDVGNMVEQDLTSGATITPDYAVGDMMYLDLNHDAVIDNVTNMVVGQIAEIQVKIGTANKVITFFPTLGHSIPQGQEWPTTSSVGDLFSVTVKKCGASAAKPWDITITPLSQTGGNAAPNATVTLTGSDTVGSTLTGDYTFSDPGDTEDLTATGSQYSLRYHDAATGNFASGTVIEEGDVLTTFGSPRNWLLDTTPLSKYVKLWIDVVDSVGNHSGWRESAAIGPIAPAVANQPAITYLGSATYLNQTELAGAWTLNQADLGGLNFNDPGDANEVVVAVVNVQGGALATSATSLSVAGVAFQKIDETGLTTIANRPSIAMFQALAAGNPGISIPDPLVVAFTNKPQKISIDFYRLNSTAQIAAASRPKSNDRWISSEAIANFPPVSTSGAGLLLQAAVVEGGSAGTPAMLLISSDGQIVHRQVGLTGQSQAVYKRYVSGTGGKLCQFMNSGGNGAGLSVYFESL